MLVIDFDNNLTANSICRLSSSTNRLYYKINYVGNSNK